MSNLDHFPHLIAGHLKPAGRREIQAPYDLCPIATVDDMGPDGVEQALATAYTLYRNRDAWLTLARRIEILEKTIQLMGEQAEELAVEAAREGGKPLIDSRAEVARAIDGVRICIDMLRTQAGEVIPMGVNAASLGHLGFTTKEPIGVVVALSAFNHPLNLIVHQAGPAVAAGCPVIVKPASDTPLSCMRFIRLLHQAGLPPEWAQAMVVSDRQAATKLATDSRVGFLSFIGSGAVGWRLRSQLAPGTRCALEHGGVAPVIVEADADLESALPSLAKGGFYHAGQVCVSVQRVYAHRSVARRVAEGLAELGGAMSVGNPTRAETDIGPMIRPEENERVHQWVAEAVEGGAELLCGGEKLSETCYPATVLLNPPEDAKVSTHEVFGPVICVYAFDDRDEAVARANALPYSFQASVFTRDLDSALRAYRRLDASAVMVNQFTAFRVDWMPFAGLRESGLGVGGIPHTMKEMQIEKLMVIRSREV